MSLASIRPCSIGATTSRSGCTIKTGHLVLRTASRTSMVQPASNRRTAISAASQLVAGRTTNVHCPPTRQAERARPTPLQGHDPPVPADPREIAPHPRLVHLTWRTGPPQSALGIGTVEDETAHPLGMPDRIFDCDGTAPAGPHQGILPEVGRLDHTFEIAHPGLE